MLVLCPPGDEQVNLGSQRKEVDPGHQNDSWQNLGEESGLLTHVRVSYGHNALLQQPNFLSTLLSPKQMLELQSRTVREN